MKIECFKCDGCKKIIKNDNYYYIDIYQVADKNGMFTAKGMSNNLTNNSDKFLGQQTTYCEECVDKIKRYIENLSLIVDDDKWIIRNYLGEEKIAKKHKKYICKKK